MKWFFYCFGRYAVKLNGLSSMKNSYEVCGESSLLYLKFASKSIVGDLNSHPIEIFLHCDLAT